MKKTALITIGIIVLLFGSVALVSGQSVVKGMSLNGSTGLISTPTARIGWELSNIGIDAGYSFVYAGAGAISHIPALTVSFLKRAELGIALDLETGENPDILVHGKFQFYKTGNSALAVGGNYQAVNDNDGAPYTHAGQAYFAVTYGGDFFKWPANTTLVLGKTFQAGMGFFPIDFSMGFELSLFPGTFKDYVHWIVDFANYSYSIEPTGANSGARGVFNTGIRIDPIKGSNLKLNFDIAGTDLLDGPGFLIAVCLGWAPN